VIRSLSHARDIEVARSSILQEIAREHGEQSNCKYRIRASEDRVRNLRLQEKNYQALLDAANAALRAAEDKQIENMVNSGDP
jgi:hypothetical protein